ncbi:emp24/gp25L/p24 family protein [Galdieria sulphuraria]|uniref:Emp24/gp25L/p24 family protein n=1 Tax=Galdieria sulphuraria TaxID=130081 RepID=M2W7Y6_GALSU|nr:emp24/gp25L/p24 family protein [Galdieria sulphuraria]EME31951.1 emp24/gp25L/p24 family protein [Galdieria sulphuraria]|eukprot:XP_005708471.1 emp24/gp25L/p24 family protein [Galdieria sulphuraria]
MSSTRWLTLFSLVFIFLLYIQTSIAFEFYLNKNAKLCFTEQLTSNTKVSGEYAVAGSEGTMSVDLTVIGPDRRDYFSKLGIESGRFTFKTPKHPILKPEDAKYAADEHFPPAVYHFCFSARSLPENIEANAHQPQVVTRRRVSLKVDVLPTERDYARLAKEEHLNSLEVALRRIEDEIRQFSNELDILSSREQTMRNINEITNSRVTWLGIFNVLVMIAAGIYEMYHMKNYFRHKKLI